MINSFIITNNRSESLTLELRSPEKSGFSVKSVHGLGPTIVNINQTELLSIPGASYNSHHIQNRNIVFNLGFYDDGSRDIDVIRRDTYKYFPLGEEIDIIIVTDTKSYKISGRVESNKPEIFTRNSGSMISIICDAAYLQGLGDELIEFYQMTDSFSFPFSNESITEGLIEFGVIDWMNSAIINYDGHGEVGILITIEFGNNTYDIVVSNLITGRSMAFDNTILTSILSGHPNEGDVLTINTRPGQKSATVVNGDDEWDVLRAIVDLGNPELWITLVPGNNLIECSASGYPEAMKITLEYTPIFEGV